VIAEQTLLSFFIRNETVIDLEYQTSKESESFIFITGHISGCVGPLKSIAPPYFPFAIRVTQFIVPLFAYCETSFTIDEFSHNVCILSKLYMATNPES